MIKKVESDHEWNAVGQVLWTSDPACPFCPAHIFTPTIPILAASSFQPICEEKEAWTVLGNGQAT